MDRPTLRQLECALAVAEHKSFRRAAESLYLSQPALSVHVQQLEELLGTKLFERDRRRVLITAAGQKLLPHAHAALLAADGLVAAAQELDDPLAGVLRLGVIPTLAPYVLAGVVAPLRRSLPRLRLLLREDRTAELVSAAREGELDLLLLALEADLGTLATRALYSDPFVLLVPATHALAGRKAIRPSDLEAEEVLLLEDGHCFREQALALCARSGALELGDFRATSLSTLVRMVAIGSGVTLLPALAVPFEVKSQDRLVALPLEKRWSRTIGCAWRATFARGALLERVMQVFSEHAPAGTVIVPSARR